MSRSFVNFGFKIHGPTSRVKRVQMRFPQQALVPLSKCITKAERSRLLPVMESRGCSTARSERGEEETAQAIVKMKCAFEKSNAQLCLLTEDEYSRIGGYGDDRIAVLGSLTRRCNGEELSLHS